MCVIYNTFCSMDIDVAVDVKGAAVLSHGGPSDDAIIEALVQIAECVQGAWVIKSALAPGVRTWRQSVRVPFFCIIMWIFLFRLIV